MANTPRTRESPEWKGLAFPLRREDEGLGASVQEQNIADSIKMILTTPLGSRVNRPDFGSILPDLVDRPMTNKTRALVCYGTVEAVKFWEPRVEIKNVRSYAELSNMSRLVVELTVLSRLTGRELTISYIYDREARRWAR